MTSSLLSSYSRVQIPDALLACSRTEMLSTVLARSEVHDTDKGHFCDRRRETQDMRALRKMEKC